MDAKQQPRWQHLHDDALLAQLRSKLAEERCATAEVLALMAEVDRRRLYAQAACDSMFSYATSVLGMSEAAAYKRIQVARATRRYPSILERVADGRLHLSGLCLLVPHLTADNHAELPLCTVQQTVLPASAMRTAPANSGCGNAASARVESVELGGAAHAGNACARPPVVHTQQHPQPLGPQRYLLKVTVSTAVCDKLKQCQELLAGQVPDGDIPTV